MTQVLITHLKKETNSDSNGTLSKNDKDCFHSSWKSCHSHIISIIHRILANMKCLKCNKLVPNDKYQLHLKTEHQIEKLVVCPLCGVLDKEISLATHINLVHSGLSLQDHPTSSFFNLATSLQKQPSVNQTDTSIQNFPVLDEDFYVYQCLNCHQFFPSNCSFSHNCWTYTAVSNTNGHKQPLTNNNYFSPIFLKFNVSRVLNSRAFQQPQANNNKISLPADNAVHASEEGINYKKMKLHHSLPE